MSDVVESLMYVLYGCSIEAYGKVVGDCGIVVEGKCLTQGQKCCTHQRTRCGVARDNKNYSNPCRTAFIESTIKIPVLLPHGFPSSSSALVVFKNTIRPVLPFVNRWVNIHLDDPTMEWNIEKE